MNIINIKIRVVFKIERRYFDFFFLRISCGFVINIMPRLRLVDVYIYIRFNVRIIFNILLTVSVTHAHNLGHYTATLRPADLPYMIISYVLFFPSSIL